MRLHSYVVLLSIGSVFGCALNGDALPSGWVLSQSGVGGVSEAVANLNPTQGSVFGWIDNTGTTDMRFTGVPGAATGSTLTSPTFTLASGQQLSIDLNFLTNDGEEFSDFAYAALVRANTSTVIAKLYTANTTGSVAQAVPALGGPGGISAGVALTHSAAYFDGMFTGLLDNIPYGPTKYIDGVGGATGWVTASYRPGAGSYQILFVVSNVGDPGLESALAIDNLRSSGGLIDGFEINAPVVPEPNTVLMIALGIATVLRLRRRKRQHTNS